MDETKMNKGFLKGWSGKSGEIPALGRSGKAQMG